MKLKHRNLVHLLLLVALCCFAAGGSVAFAAIKSMALVVAAGSKLPDVTLVEISKLSKGSQKTWPDGRAFTLVMKDPTSPEMRVAVQKLFGVTASDAMTAIAKINESRPLIKIVPTDDDVFRVVTSTPGAVGIVDVYAINSAVKVLHIDGKLPFDIGYPLK